MIEVNEIKARREANGLTQKALAERSGVSEALIKKIEQGAHTNVGIENLKRIDAALAQKKSKAA